MKPQRPSAYVPKTFEGQRAAFISTFVNDLERPYLGFLSAQLTDVIGKNEAIFGAPCYYLGDTVYARGLVVARIGKYKLGGMATLDPSLQPLHDEWQSHYDEHNATWQRFSQSLRVVLLAAKDWQMLRDMLPDHVLQPYMEVWGLEHLTRTRPHLHACAPRPTILPQPRPMDEYMGTWDLQAWDERLVLQYAAIAFKVDLYVGYRLL